jgi:hypothetical protein
MRFVDEYRSGDLAKSLADQIAGLVEPGRHYKFMEVCGGHTHAIYKHGVEDLLPDEIELVHGPAPVCVIPMGRQDDAISIAEQPNIIFTTFGDMMRVPATKGSLLDAKARGADVRMVYSPLDALKIARENPDREVVFFAIGFETTTPSTALTLKRAQAESIRNFSLFCNHVTIIRRSGRSSTARPARRVHRARARLHRDRPASVPLHRATTASLWSSRVRAADVLQAPRDPAQLREGRRSRESVQPGVRERESTGAGRRSPRRWSCGPPRWRGLASSPRAR